MNKILTNIENGWCNFNLGDFNGHPSYIKYLPFDVLDAYNYYKYNNHCIMDFDCETYQFCLIIWEYNLIILDNKNDKINTTVIDIDAEEVLNELVNEIINDIDLWARWISMDVTDKGIEFAKQNILNKIKEYNIKGDE